MVALAAIARDLARLAADRQLLSLEEVDCALAGHAQLVDLLVTVHGDLTGRRGRGQDKAWARARGNRDVALLGEDPVGLLGRLLVDHPRPDTDVATTDLLAKPASSKPGRCWQRILRNTTSAAHSWRSADPTSLPEGPAAWTALADVAALAQAVACVTPGLSESVRQAGRKTDALRLADGSSDALWRAAGEVRALARLGPLPPVSEPYRPARWPVRVRQAQALPEAQTRLRSLLRSSAPLRPEHIEQIAAAQANCLSHIGFSLPGQQHTTSNALAAALAPILQRPGTSTAAYAGDQRAVVQAREIHDFITKTLGVPPDDLDSYGEWLARVPSTLEALCDAVKRHFQLGLWLVPNPSNPEQWTPYIQSSQPRTSTSTPHGDVDEPHLMTAARDLAKIARAARHRLRPLADRIEAARVRHLTPPRHLRPPVPPQPRSRPDLTR